MLRNISIAWTWLDRTLNGMIDTINSNHILPSSTIAVQETPTGTILTVTSPQTQATDGGGIPAGQWVQINVVDASCNQFTLNVWAQGPPTAL